MPRTALARSVTAADIDAAAVRLDGVAVCTPLERNDRLSRETGAEVWFKREDLQPVRSYKIRGAYNLVAQLDDAARAAGVVTASAGNHGQGVAFACARLGVRGRVFVPSTTPRQKRMRMRVIGAGWIELVVTGDTYDDSAAAAADEAARTGAVLVPAFDDPRTVAGQGTVAAQVVDQLGAAPDVLALPVGGGGMLAGCLTWLAERAPDTRVVGFEPAGAPTLSRALEAGHPVELAVLDGFVDGAAVRRAGDLTYAVVAQHAPPVLTVPEGRVCAQMLAMYQSDGIIAEPAGALAPAGLGLVELAPGSTVVAVVSGGNNDVSRYAEILERALVYEGRKHYFLVDFPQEPGALRRFLDSVLGPDDDITLFEYVKRSNRETGPALVGVELGDPATLPDLLARMAASPMRVEAIDPGSTAYRFLVAP
ncbi:MAG: threonine ammonia-lyase IlvA [Micrococcales bacterium]|nr:threonine ammonia-lyase IlvA [Micrococcales bacterium]